MVLNKTRLIRSEMEKEGIEPNVVVLQNLCRPITICFCPSIDSHTYNTIEENLKMLSVYNLNFHVERSVDGRQTSFFFSLLFLISNLKANPIVNFILANSESTSPLSQPRPTSKLCQAIDIIKRTMDKQNCSLYRGCVYRLIPESTKTFSFYKTIQDY